MIAVLYIVRIQYLLWHYSPMKLKMIFLSLAWSISMRSILCRSPKDISPCWTGIVSLVTPSNIALRCACPLRHSSLLAHIVLGSLCSRSLCWYQISIGTLLSLRDCKSFRRPSSASFTLMIAVVCLVNILTKPLVAWASLRKETTSSVRSLISKGLDVWIIISLVTNIWYHRKINSVLLNIYNTIRKSIHIFTRFICRGDSVRMRHEPLSCS